MAFKYNERTGEFEEDSTRKDNYVYKENINKSNKKFSVSSSVKRLLITLLICNLVFGLLFGEGMIGASFVGLYVWFFYLR